MYATTFLSAVWGPIVLALGVGIFVSRPYYLKAYRDLEKDPLAVLVFGIFAMAIGILQISAHNIWNTLPEIIISVIGWGFVVKGALFIIAPNVVDRIGDWWISKKLLTPSGVAYLVIGAYLTLVGYFF